MNMIGEQSALLQSGIDWLEGWASCQFSLVVSVLSPFFVSHLSLSLSCWRGCRMILTDDSPKCFNRNVLITGVVSHLHSCLATYTEHMEKTGSLSPTCMCYTSGLSHLAAPSNSKYRAGLYGEQGDRVTLVVWQTILQSENQWFSGHPTIVKVSLNKKVTSRNVCSHIFLTRRISEEIHLIVFRRPSELSK